MANLIHSAVTGQSLSLGGGNDQEPGFSVTPENGAQEVRNDGSLRDLQVQVRTDPGADPEHFYTVQKPSISLGYRLQDVLTDVVGMSSHGVASQTLAQISKGGTSGSYEECAACIVAARAGADGRGDDYTFRALHMIQGEADVTEGTSRQAWFDQMVQYRADLMADAGLTDLLVVASQTSTQDTLPFRSVDVEMAQLDLHRTFPWFSLAGPHYALERYLTTVHLTARGYYHLGELHARASLAKIEGNAWNPLMPATVTVTSSTTVEVKFLVPTPPIVFDTTLVTAQDHMGFSFLNSTALVSSVAITAEDTVLITADRALNPGATLGYAADTAAGRGNLRDSDPSVSAHDAYPLPNWCVIFTEPLNVTGDGSGSAYEVRSFYFVADDFSLLPVQAYPAASAPVGFSLTETFPGSGEFGYSAYGFGTLVALGGGEYAYRPAAVASSLTETSPGSGEYTLI